MTAEMGIIKTTMRDVKRAKRKQKETKKKKINHDYILYNIYIHKKKQRIFSKAVSSKKKKMRMYLARACQNFRR